MEDWLKSNKLPRLILSKSNKEYALVIFISSLYVLIFRLRLLVLVLQSWVEDGRMDWQMQTRNMTQLQTVSSKYESVVQKLGMSQHQSVWSNVPSPCWKKSPRTNSGNVWVYPFIFRCFTFGLVYASLF